MSGEWKSRSSTATFSLLNTGTSRCLGRCARVHGHSEQISNAVLEYSKNSINSINFLTNHFIFPKSAYIENKFDSSGQKKGDHGKTIYVNSCT